MSSSYRLLKMPPAAFSVARTPQRTLPAYASGSSLLAALLDGILISLGASTFIGCETQIRYFPFFPSLLPSCFSSFFASVSITAPVAASMWTSVTLPSVPSTSTSQTVLPCFFSSSASTTVPGTLSDAVLIAWSIVVLDSLARSATFPSFSSAQAVAPSATDDPMIPAAMMLSILKVHLLAEEELLCLHTSRSSRWHHVATFGRIAGHRSVMRVGHTSPMRVRLTASPAFMLLHHLFVLGLLLRALFRGEEGEDFASGLDGGHAEASLQGFALFQLRFDRAKVGFLVIRESLQLTFSDLNVGFHLYPGLIQSQMHLFQLGDLVWRQPDVFLMFQEVTDQVAGAAMQHAHAVAAHHSMATTPSSFLPITVFFVAQLISPDGRHTKRQREHNSCARSEHIRRIPLHSVLLCSNQMIAKNELPPE